MASMHEISVPVFVRRLNGIAGCLKKAQALYGERKYDETTLISYRLYPDMFNFARQIQARPITPGTAPRSSRGWRRRRWR